MDEQQIDMQNQKNLNFSEIVVLLKKYWLRMLCVVVAITILSGIASIFLAKPKYTAKASIIIDYVPKTETNAAAERNAFLLALDLIETIKDFSTQKIVAKQVEQRAETDANIETNFVRNLKINSEQDSLLVSFEYTAKTSESAIATVNAVVESLIEVADTKTESGEIVYKTLYENIKIVDPAEKSVVSNSKLKVIAIGFAIGLIIAIAYVFVLYLLDDTIKSRSDLERITGFKAIAFIEDIRNANDK